MAVFAAMLLLAGAARFEAQGSERRAVFVSVLDKQGNPVSGLTAANFKGEFRGQPVTILSVAEHPAPRHVAIVVDVSGSQAGSIRSEWTQAEHLIGQLVPRASVAIFTVNGKLARYSDLTTDRDVIQNALRDATRRTPDGPSSLYDGVLAAAETLQGLGPGDTICLLSDGDDDSSRRSATDAARTLASESIRMFLIGEVVNDPGGRLRRLAPSGAWGVITDATGGWATSLGSFAPNPDQIVRLTSVVAAAILDCYRIEFDTAMPIDKARSWRLDVRDPDGRPLKDVRVLYPHVLIPSAAGH